MPSSDSTRRLAGFGLFELDLQTGELRKKGVKVALQEQPFRVLAMLVARPGELVTRDDLRAALWPDAVFVDFDHGVNKAVGKIRHALGDLADSPRFVETLERRGYRFIAPVEWRSEAGSPSTPATPTGTGPLVQLVADGRTIPLSSGAHLIGRDPASAVWIDSSFVSRRHAVVRIDEHGATLEDLGSHNGSFVNGERISGCRPLANGDEIRIGPARFLVRTPEPGGATRTEVR
jgi:DNA-binding winged helix-turn-helix (wHTH) protein